MISWREQKRSGRKVTEVFVSVALVILILLLAVPFFNKMVENFEKTAVNNIVQQLNSVATFKMAEYVALDKLRQLHQELDDNPLKWLAAEELILWDNYKGEVDVLDFNQMDEQTWVYDRTRSRLVYKVKYPHLLVNEDPITNRIQFQFVMDYVDYNEDSRFNADTDTINGVLIKSVYPYDWIQE